MAKDHGPQIKDDETYDALRDKGYSKEKSARIANAQAKDPSTARRGGEASSYDDMTKDQLYQRAKEIGIEGRAKMNKGELIDALRNH
jgi:hypothetical protein